MHIWSDRHASASNFVLCPLCCGFWNMQSCSPLIAIDLVYVLVTSGPTVTEQTPSQNTISNFEKLEICKGVTSQPHCRKLCDRWCFKNFASVAGPFIDLTTKGVLWQWGPHHQHAFQQLKDALCSVPVLLFRDPKLHYIKAHKSFTI